MRAFAGRIGSEVGSQGEQAQIAFAETIFNRAAARGRTLKDTVSGNYFPSPDPGESDRSAYFEIIRKVFSEGTNYTSGATGNASLCVGFGKGWKTAGFGGECFGVEEEDISWRPAFKFEKPDSTEGIVCTQTKQ